MTDSNKAKRAAVRDSGRVSQRGGARGSAPAAAGDSDAQNPYRANEPLFMAHMIAGYPTISDAEKVAEGLGKGGPDFIELQIPFSDPMADGPTIAVACEDALKAGATVASSLTLLSKVSRLGKPVSVMSYLNPVFRKGIPNFVKTIKAGSNAPPLLHFIKKCESIGETGVGNELPESCFSQGNTEFCENDTRR